MTRSEWEAQKAELERKLRKAAFDSPEEAQLRQEYRSLLTLEADLEPEQAGPEDPQNVRNIQAQRDYIEHARDVYTGNVEIHQEVPPEDTSHLREAYLHHVIETCGQVELSGIDRKAVDQQTEACLDLSAIYTALLTRSTDFQDTDVEAITRDHRQEHQLSALEQLNRHQRLVLLGEPGSGKSTFVKFVAMCLAGESLSDLHCAKLTRLTSPLPDEQGEDTDEPQNWEHGALLPLVVILRDFAARGLPSDGETATGKHLWNFICRTLDERRLGGYADSLETLLHKEGGLLLLDGLDEVPKAGLRRGQIKQAVEDFAGVFHRCRILVTSRTYAYQKQEWRLKHFQETVLAPFTDGQIRRFVGRWYRHMAEIRAKDLENAQGRAELLKRAIFSRPRLHDFAQRPLLLTLMTSLHAWRGGSLPEKRGELYAEATDMLLDWWEQDKVVRNAKGEILASQPSLTEMLRVGKDALQGLLNRLAFEAHQGQADLVGTADIPEEKLVTRLMKICKNAELNPTLLLSYLSERAGLLVSRGVEVYSFPHRSFQEYLAAYYLTSQQNYPDNIAELARNEPNRWREVLLLAAAKASDIAPMIWTLAEALCYQNPDDGWSAQDAWGALFAAQTLVESAQLDEISPPNQLKVKRIQDWLVAILTEQQPFDPSTHSGQRSTQGKPSPFPVVERALAGNLLAVLGDPRPGVGLREDGLPDIEWCEVPGGTFLMGEEYELKELSLPDFQISRYPVTNAQYRAFIDDGGYTERWRNCWTNESWKWREKGHITEPDWRGGDFDLANHPVVRVSWHEATAFGQWLTMRLRATGELNETQEIRLPTGTEWEKAARGVDGRTYPWGDEEITPEHANYDETDLGATNTVGCFSKGRSPYGCEEMSGNVWEWCQDLYLSSGSRRVMRGGAWIYFAGFCRAAFRDPLGPGFRNGFIGFRLLRT